MTPEAPETAGAAGERSAKWLARAGVASRLDAERLIAEGKVRLNGAPVAHPASFVQPGDIVRGASLVVWAIRDGRDAAVQMHAWMRQRTVKDAALRMAAE